MQETRIWEPWDVLSHISRGKGHEAGSVPWQGTVTLAGGSVRAQTSARAVVPPEAQPRAWPVV